MSPVSPVYRAFVEPRLALPEWTGGLLAGGAPALTRIDLKALETACGGT